MGARPDHVDLSRDSLDPPFLYLGELSPRIGGVPPALSPLDAFALHGRLLQKKFEEQNAKGRRISRLPPLTVANEFARRPDFFRSASGESGVSGVSEPPEIKTEDNVPWSSQECQHAARPKSHYPQILSSKPSSDSTRFSTWEMWSRMEEQGQTITEPQDYFAIPRTHSPEPVDAKTSASTTVATTAVSAGAPHDLASPVSSMRRTSTMDSASSAGWLAPPRSPAPAGPSWTTASVRSVPGEGSEADIMSVGGSFDSLSQRKTSTRTSISRSHSPCSSYRAPLPRSSSFNSDWSCNGGALPQPSYNFSRPLSRASRPSCDSKYPFDVPFRQVSGDSIKTPPPSDRVPMKDSGFGSPTFSPPGFVYTPASMASEEYFSPSDPNGQPGSSYIHSKYALPRGRAVNREPANMRRSSSHPPNEDGFTQPLDAIHTPRVSLTRPPSPVSMDSASISSRRSTTESKTRPRTSFAEDRGSPQPKSHHQSFQHKSHLSSKSSASNASTIKAPVVASAPPRAAEPTPEEHLQKGIECHESGSLQESTYHLRIAAKAGNPTAMLLYALACRHGWGMRPNQADAVQWLQKAVELSQLEVDNDEQGQPLDRQTGMAEQKTHRAQLALSIYELGVSYMNGWGVKQDRALALRCFEIAGNWGDADALAEAGFCYTEGLGCKKDLRKAARLYRAAEKKGMSMTGNSWIYKEKYMDAPEGRTKQPRDKTRTRTIFGRKKSSAS